MEFRDNSFLNIFSAYRAAGQRQDQNRQQAVENKFATADQGIQDAAALRDQQAFDQERAQRTTLGALSAYSNMVDSISSPDSGIAEVDRPQAHAAAFDRIAPALQAAGLDPQQVDGLRAQLIENPNSAGDILAGLSGSNGGSSPSLQAAIGPDGQPVFLDPRTRRPVAQGYRPATTVIGQGRLEVAQQNADTAGGNLEQRQLGNDLEHIEGAAEARATGAAQGELTQQLPQIVQQFSESDSRLSQVLQNPNLRDVAGFPTVRGIFRGGFGGLAPPVAGSPAANALAELHAAASQMRLNAYQAMRGAGQITEAESEFGAAAQANLDRNQSYESLVAEIQRLQQNARARLAATQQSAAGTPSPAPAAAAPAPAAGARRPPAPDAAPAAAPQGGLRRQGEDTDALLNRLGL